MPDRSVSLARLSTCSVRSRSARRAGFTLIELLVVIGIIGVLISILIPVISRVRQSANEANTRNEISQIASACQRYYDDWHAYPGPLSNSAIESKTCNVKDTGGTVLSNITGSENLVLGLLGGLSTPSASGNPAIYVTAGAPSTLVGVGPRTLNFNDPNPRQYTSYLNIAFPSSTLLSKGSFVDQSGLAALDSEVPEFVDQIPYAMPILYIRARVGVSGVICNGVLVDPVTTTTAVYNYDLREITPYTTTGIGIPPGGGAIVGSPGKHGLQDVGAAINMTYSTTPTTVPQNTIFNAGMYFLNQAIPPATAAANYGNSGLVNKTGTARAKDTFILISAGRSRTYGASDNITSFGEVQP